MTLSKPALKLLLAIVTLCASVSMFFSPPILQDISYHHFADQRKLFGIPNFWNVISNLPFLLVGIIALYRLYKNRLNIVRTVNASYITFFTAVAFISFGSAYYHWQPNNLSLVLDRLPMTFAFMSMLSFALAEYLSVNWGRISLLPLLMIGLLSIAYWYWGYIHGSGDLRWYALVQFVPLLLLLHLFLFGQKKFNNQSGYWWLFSAYILAKSAEHFDVAIFKYLSGIISGHTLKHILSAVGLYVLIIFFEKRSNS
jgi:hypothetical protein